MVRRSLSRADGHRHHGHRRQDHDVVPGRLGTRGSGCPDRDDRDDRDPDRRSDRRSRRARDDARGARVAGRAAGDGRCRRSGGGHRDDLPRACARPRGRRRLRRRDPHEHDPRASRAPRDVGGVSRRQAVALRPAARGSRHPEATGSARPRRSSTSTIRRRGCSSASARDAGAHVITYGTEPAADIRATRVSEDGAGVARRHRHVRRRGDDRPPPCRPLQRPQRARGRRPRRGARARRGSACGPGWRTSAVVPGRMERIDLGQPFGVVVDFAHSPASLRRCSTSSRPSAAARGGGVIAVFGSAGERDTAKRPQMGRIAGERCSPRRRDRRGPARRGPRRHPRRRSHAAPRRPAGGATTTCCSSPDRRAAIAAAFERGPTRRHRPAGGEGPRALDHRPGRASGRGTSATVAEEPSSSSAHASTPGAPG